MNQTALGSMSLLDAAYEEYCRRLGGDDRLPTQEFLKLFPDIQASLARLIELHHLPQPSSEPIRWPLVGDTFLGFRLESHLGRGAFAHVFLATQPALGNRKVAVKITTRGHSEAFTLGRVVHPGIIPIHSISHDEKSRLSAICMPYVGRWTLLTLLDRLHAEPESPRTGDMIARIASAETLESNEATSLPARRWRLRSLLSRKPTTYEQAIRNLFAHICDALAALHDAGIVHQDLKPSNVLLSREARPILLDFNLAVDRLAKPFGVGGTALYMSPEQLDALSGKGGPTASIHSDLFSLGVMFWEVLTGEHPFGPLKDKITKENLVPTLRERQRGGFAPSDAAVKSLSKATLDIARRLLQLEPAARPASARLVKDLFVGKPSRRRRLLGIGTAVFLAGTAIGGAYVLSRTSEESPAAALDPKASYRKGVAELNGGDAGGAIMAFTQAIQSDPRNAKAWLGRGIARVSLRDRTSEDLASALADVQSAQSLEAKAPAFALHGFVLQQMKQPALAENYYRKSLLEDLPTWPEIKNNLAVAIADKNPDEALQLLDEAVKARPESHVIHYNRGMVRFLRGMALMPPAIPPKKKEELRKGSIEDFEKAIKLGPPSSHIHLQLAKAVSFPPVPSGVDGGEAFRHLATYLELGGDPATLQRDGAWKHVRGDERFAKLPLDGPAGSTIPFPRLIDPITPLLGND
jgi:serine/threonine protein kinase/Tfp pilus assembly protein PilF